ncbi:MAG: COG4705 family protein [bacterium]
MKPLKKTGKKNAASSAEEKWSKVPEVVLLFWLIKIAATTLGETGGDAVTMSMKLGYLVGTAIFAVIFLVAVVIQIKAPRFHPVIYWFTIIATTTVGTTLADFSDRSLGIGYAGGSSLLLCLLLGSLALWYFTMGSVSINTVGNAKTEIFYWVTIMFSQTLGTALGDWTADTEGMGYLGGVTIFVVLLAVIAGLYYKTRITRTFLFWAAFILTRPLGAVLGDFLDKPVAHGGLDLSRYSASAVLFLFILGCIFIFPHRAARKAH